MIEASAPVRICDIGGWTDTWFGGPGRVTSIAVTPGVEVSIRALDGADAVMLDVENFGDRYEVVPGATRAARHPLLEAAIDAMPPRAGRAVEIRVRSAVPAGCGAGTSAAVAVAVLGGLAALRAEELKPRDAAYAAHRLEVDVLGLESGIQDQLSAAFGGINYMEIEPYPQASVRALPAWPDLGAVLTLVFLGRAHDSSGVHRQVIDDATREKSGAVSEARGAFAQLRAAAGAARDAVLAQDLGGLGRAMIANTDAQRALHPGLVGRDASAVIGLAAARGSVGWKVNGAGGDGGSVTILQPNREAKATFDRHVTELDARYRVLSIQLSPVGPRARGAL